MDEKVRKKLKEGWIRSSLMIEALAIKPEVAIPIHYGDIVGSQKDAEKFASLVKEAEVKIL